MHQIAIEPDGSFAFNDDALLKIKVGGQVQALEVRGSNDAIGIGDLNVQVLIGKPVDRLMRNDF